MLAIQRSPDEAALLAAAVDHVHQCRRQLEHAQVTANALAAAYTVGRCVPGSTFVAVDRETAVITVREPVPESLPITHPELSAMLSPPLALVPDVVPLEAEPLEAGPGAG